MKEFRLVLYNPHIDDFFYEPISYRILKRRPLKKYGSVLKNIDTYAVYIDYTESGVIPYKWFKYLPYLLKKYLVLIELKFWQKINLNVNYLREIRDTDVLLVMSYKSCHNLPIRRLREINKFRKVIVHLSHYFVNTAIKSKNIQKIGSVFLAGDSDITDNDYFCKYFDWYQSKPFLILPFALHDKWLESYDENFDRQGFVASGTVHELNHEVPKSYYHDYISSTGLNNYHPRRVEAMRYFRLMSWSTFVSYYRPRNRNWLISLFSQFMVSQKSYFKINLKDEYLRHKFAVIGEERTGFPAIGAIEAMACGCVVLVDPSKYIGLTVKPGENCLGVPCDIEKATKIALSLSKNDVERIRRNARLEAVDHWNASYVARIWTYQITQRTGE